MSVAVSKEQGEMADSLARTKLNVFLSFTTLVYSSICFYDTFFSRSARYVFCRKC